MKPPAQQCHLNQKVRSTVIKLGFALLVLACFTVNICCANTILPGTDDSRLKAAGRILLPLSGSLTGNRVDVSGFTKNLNLENYFIWLVIDKPGQGLCWPQNVTVSGNCSFSTTINITGHVNAYILSLYIVDKKQNERITAWLSSGESKGLSLFSRNTLLHSIRLWNQKLDM